MTPLIYQQPVKDVKHMADCVAGELFPSCDDLLLERDFVRVIVGEVMKLNAKNNA